MPDCGYQCYEIGGPWIAENPNCPVHNQNQKPDFNDDIEKRLSDLEKRVKELLDKMSK